VLIKNESGNIGSYPKVYLGISLNQEANATNAPFMDLLFSSWKNNWNSYALSNGKIQGYLGHYEFIYYPKQKILLFTLINTGSSFNTPSNKGIIKVLSDLFNSLFLDKEKEDYESFLAHNQGFTNIFFGKDSDYFIKFLYLNATYFVNTNPNSLLLINYNLTSRGRIAQSLNNNYNLLKMFEK